MSRPHKPTPPPSVVADTFVPNATDDNPEYADNTSDPLAPGPRDVPYLPTDQNVVHKMMELCKLTKDDVLYDLGCGDGRIVITAAKLGARGVGVEIDLKLLRECHENLRNTGVRDRCEFRRQSFFDVDLRPATIVALYLLPAINKKLLPKLLWELRPGARIVANYFDIAGWEPDEQVVFKHRPLMLWYVPAWVAGHYRCLFRTADRRQFHLDLHLTRNLQRLTGEIRFGKKRLPLRDGRVRGSQIELTLPELPGIKAPAKLRAAYDDGRSRNTVGFLQGTFMAPGAVGVWAGMRITSKRSTNTVPA